MVQQVNTPAYSAYEIVFNLFGANTYTQSDPVITSVGTSVVKVLDGNPNRLAYTIVNMSDNTLYVAFDEQVSATRGIVLGASGGNLAVSVKDDFTLVTRPVYALASGGSSAIFSYQTLTYAA